jgi:hypothetical protein
MYVRCSLMLAIFALAMTTSSASAQSQALSTVSTPAQMLQPHSASPLLAPVKLHEDAALLNATRPTQPRPALVRRRGPGFALMIAGGALFVAGLLTGGSAGTVMDLAGAGIGAYGLYLYFQ